jgi:AraC family transcriptional regulator
MCEASAEDAPFAASLRAADALPSALLLCSEALGWRSLLVRAYRDADEADEFVTPPSPDPLIVVVTRGRCVIESRNGGRLRRATYHPGSIGATAPGHQNVLRWHSISAEPLQSLHLHLSARLVEETAQELGSTGLRPPDALLLDDALVVESARAIERAVRQDAPALYADSLAQMLAVHLLHGVKAEETVDRPSGLGEAGVRRITSYMKEHLHEDVNLDDLAVQANVSKYHLLRLFKAATGHTPHRYLVWLRMMHAAHLLRYTQQSVLQIAVACGYRSPGQFAAGFRRQYGASPSDFRGELQRLAGNSGRGSSNSGSDPTR